MFSAAILFCSTDCGIDADNDDDDDDGDGKDSDTAASDALERIGNRLERDDCASEACSWSHSCTLLLDVAGDRDESNNLCSSSTLADTERAVALGGLCALSLLVSTKSVVAAADDSADDADCPASLLPTL
jgi:hypothetical protein